MTSYVTIIINLGSQHGEIVCKVNNQGVLGNKKGEYYVSMLLCCVLFVVVVSFCFAFVVLPMLSIE